MEAHAVEGRAVFAVIEVDVVEAHVAVDVLELDRVGLLLTLGLHVQVVEDALEDGQRRDDLHLNAGQRRCRRVEASEIADERDDRSDRDAAVDREPRAREPHQRRADDDHRVDRGHEPAADHRETDLEIHQFRPGAIEARALERFPHERLDQRDAGDREGFLGDRFDLVALPARQLADVVHPPADRRERNDHQRDDRERHQRQAPVQNENRDDGRDHRRDVGYDRHERAGHHVVDVVDVGGDAVHDLAGLRAGEERERHVVEVRDEGRADVAHDPLADQRVEIALIDADHAARDRAHHHAGDVEADEPHIVLGDRVVDDPFRKQRRHQADDRADHDAQEHRRFLLPIGQEKGAQPPPIDLALDLRTIGTEHL